MYEIIKCGAGETSIPMVENAEDYRYATVRFYQGRPHDCLAISNTLISAEQVCHALNSMEQIKQLVGVK